MSVLSKYYLSRLSSTGASAGLGSSPSPKKKSTKKKEAPKTAASTEVTAGYEGQIARGLGSSAAQSKAGDIVARAADRRQSKKQK